MKTTEELQKEQGSDIADYAKRIENYYNKPKENKKQSKEEILAKYFTPRNPTEEFRIAPPLKGREMIESAFFHYVRVNDPKATKGKTYRKIYCPLHNSPKVPKLDAQGSVISDKNGKLVMIAERCALCEKKAKILSKQNNTTLKNSDGRFLKKEEMNQAQLIIKEKNDEIYKDAMQYDPKKYHIVRGIDRGKIKDGIKFWRFKDNFKSQGVLDKLVPALKLFIEEYKNNPTSSEVGTDLYINVVEAVIPGINKKYKDVSSITAKKPSKLSDDPINEKQWLEDKSTWRDVFKPASMTRVLTPEQYLDRVAEGTDPYWDELTKKYVFPSPIDSSLQEQANERTQSLEGSEREKTVEQASDLVNTSYDINISDVKKEDVGEFEDNHENIGEKFETQSKTKTKSEELVKAEVEESYNDNDDDDDDNDYNDLPF